MQKLLKRNTYTPQSASPALGNCDPVLNKDQGLSVLNLKTFNNISEENLLQSAGGLKVNAPVYVINKNNKPLMHTTPCKARHLIEAGKAKIIHRTPFTIQLLHATGESKQPITLGIDPDHSFIGYSAITNTKELISGELELRNDIKHPFQTRYSCRRTRRGRLWYREPRFNNRSRPEWWLPPSIQHKLDSHLKLTSCITSTIIEIATFDQQKMQNLEISSINYQQDG